MNINDIALAKIQKEKDDENFLLKKIHENYKKENVIYKINIQKAKVNLMKKNEKRKRKDLIKNILLITSACTLLIILVFTLKKMDDDFMNECTKYMSESVCRSGL